MGFGGAFLHSRTQLETEYMSEEWLDLMEFCANVLKENGMETYLYDEDRWPSGTCGGTVTMTKEFQEKSLNYREIKNFNSYKKCENFIALFAVTFDKIEPHTHLFTSKALFIF